MPTFILALLLGIPLFLMWAEKRIAFVRIMSPIILCYALGLLLANLPFISWPEAIPRTVSEVAVPLAIPLLLISTDIKKWIKGARPAVLSFSFCILSVTIVAAIAAFLFQDTLTASWKLAGMTMGVYTGGTPNMSAIGLALDVSEETFILMNAADMVWGALYLLFLMTLAKSLLGKFLPMSSSKSNADAEPQGLSFGELKTKDRIKNVALFAIIALVIVGMSVGLAQVLTGEMSVIVIILTVTTAGVGLSFVTSLRIRPGSYELGEYFLLVFCLALGSLADVANLVSSASDTLFFTGFVMFGSITLHFLMAYFARLDRDTVIITSVAGIYGPAFVGPIAKVLQNKSVILAGMTTGLIGYAIGNYLGIGFALLLSRWF